MTLNKHIWIFYQLPCYSKYGQIVCVASPTRCFDPGIIRSFTVGVGLSKSSRVPSGFESASLQIRTKRFNSLNYSPHIDWESNLLALKLGMSKNESVKLKTSIFLCDHYSCLVKDQTNKNFPEAIKAVVQRCTIKRCS